MKIMFYILFYLFLSFADPVFAASPTTGLDKDPSVDSAAVTAVADDHSAKETVDKDSDGTEPATGEVASSYVYDLKKLIIKSRENIKRVNEKIKEQSVVKRNQKREERAREYYQQGLQLQDEGKFDQAREYFEKAIRITEHPEMIKYIDQSALKLKAQETAIKRQERQQLRSLAQDKQVKMMDAATAYTQAVAYYKEKKYKEAKDMFTHVEELSENYKGTQSYLRIIDQNILESEASLNKQDKKELQRQREEAEKARQREKENWRKEIEAKEKSRKNQINAQADNVYTEAVKLYKTKKFMEAKKKFEEVEWVVPDYKASRDYIARADKDMAAEVAHVEQIKAKELALQQWEEEVAKRKKEALEKKEAEEKEKQRIKQLEEQDTFIYQAAIALFDKKSYDEALEKFTDVEKTLSGFRSTKAYIAKIAYIKEKEKQKQAQIAALEARRKAQEEERKKKQDDLIKEAETKRKVIQDEQIKREELKAKAAAAKRQQIEDARKKKEEEIKRAAEQIKNRTKDVKEPVKPLTVIVQIKHKPVPVPKPALTKEQEIDEARTIEALSERSALVLQKIGLLAADKRIAPVKKKMAKVEDMLNRIKMQKEIILRQLREDEDRERKRQQQIAHEQMMASIKDEYDEAIMYLRNQNYEQAQTAFMKIENDLPNYKMTRWYLGHIKENEHQAERQAVLERTQKEEDRLKALEVKREREAAIQRIALEARRRAEEERKRQLRAAQESEVQVLADKAGNLNDEILEASKVKDFGLAESKFTELEKVLETLEALKRTMTQEDRQDEQNKVKPVVKVFSQSPVEVPVIQVKRMKPITKSDEIAREQKKERRSEIKARQRDQQDHENRIRAERMSQEKARREEQDYTQDEVRRQKEEVYDHAVSLYKQKKFAAAKVIFDDLVIHNYPGSRSYLGKIDRYYEKAAAKSDAANERERSEFIAEQIRKQKMASVLAEKERARQRELTAQLERQRKIAEDEEQHQKIRIESMKMKEKDRQRLEMERSRQQLKRKNEEEQLEFRKLPIAKHEEQVKKEEPVKAIDPVKVDESQYEPEVPKDTKKDKEAAIANEKAKQEQILFSNKRKRFFEEQRSKEDKLKAEAIKKDELEKRKKDEDERKQKESKDQEERNKKATEEHFKEMERKNQETADRKKKESEERQKELERRQQQLVERKKKQDQLHQEALDRKKKLAEDRQKELERKQQETADRKRKQEKERQDALESKRKEALERQQKEEQRKLEISKENERLAQAKLEERQRKDELKRQQEQALQEIKKREELSRQAREHQKQLEDERKAIEQRLTESASAIYDEAMRLYNKGNYQAAYKKFRDLEDVLPDFKQTRKFIEQCKAFLSKPVPADMPSTVNSQDIPAQQPVKKEKKLTKEEMLPPVDRDQAIKNTLEVFDSPANAK